MQSKHTKAGFFSKQSKQSLLDTLKYSINLLWINANAHQHSEFVCVGKAREDMNYLLNQLKKWRVANPEADVNFWYDSRLTNQNAIQNTQKCLDELKQEMDSFIALRDIQEIPFVRANQDMFLPTLPVYYRVDYLKLIICLYLMEDGGEDSVTYTDFSICDKVDRALSKQELYNPTVLVNLEKWGMLTGQDTFKPENQFFQTLNTPLLIESLRHAINCSLYLSVNALNYAVKLQNRNISNNLNNITFVTMVHVYIYLMCLQSKESIQIRADTVNEGNIDEWVNYSPEKHNYCMFGNFPTTWKLGSVHLDFDTGALIRLTDIVKLPEQSGLKPNVTGILDLSEYLGATFLDQTVRKDINPGKTGSSHNWNGPLPTPSSGDKFECAYWSERKDNLTPEAKL